MAQLLIRGLEPSVILKLDELAKKKKMKREAYLRTVLSSLAVSGELYEMDFKYANLVDTVADLAKMLGDIIDKNSYVLEEVLDKFDNHGDEDDE